VIHAAIALGVQTVVVVGLLLGTNLGIYALPIAFVIYAALMSLLNQWTVVKELECRINWIQVFIKPLISSLVMGGVAYLVYTAIYLVIPNYIVAIAFAVMLAVVVYGVAMILCGGITEETLDNIPKGGMLKPIVRKFTVKRR
jgi:stage V sporulation protein B